MKQEEYELLEEVKLPRGCGSVIYIPKNTNRPYCARRFSYNDENGNPLSYNIGSYKTRGEAIKVLLDNINKSNVDFNNAGKHSRRFIQYGMKGRLSCFPPKHGVCIAVFIKNVQHCITECILTLQHRKCRSL